MHKGRLEAFTDGVIAIIITVMVLELKHPATPDLAGFAAVAPDMLGYALSFVFLGIYWNNHHHMLQSVKHVNGNVLWANLHLLFWLSLIPFATQWVGDQFDRVPVAMYGVVLFLCGLAYRILAVALVGANGKDSALARSLGTDVKGKISLVVYLVAILCSWLAPYVACALYVVVALIWLVPDRRFERAAEPEPLEK